MIIDTHSHYDDAAFDADREQLIKELNNEDIIAVNVGATYDSAFTAYEFSEKYENIYCAVGVHPDEIGELTDDKLLEIERLCHKPKTVAIGEIGLDYHWMVQPKEAQQEWFIKQIGLAKAVKLPINIHSRDAAADTLEIVKRENAGENGGIVHCYSYSVEHAREYLKLGFHFGIGGVVTYKNARVLKEVVDYLPLEALVLETDCPYLAPTPHRGERNDSRNLIYVAEAIAQIKGTSTEEIIGITCQNAKTIYRKIQ